MIFSQKMNFWVWFIGNLIIRTVNKISYNRLRINVIKTGLKRISLSYSKISLADIAKKLGLDDNEDIELIVAKVINLN